MSGSVSAIRYHDFSCGHRVYGHESKCSHMHGHNYRVWFELEMAANKQGEVASVDNIGRVMDFSIIKEILCMWLEDNWDHKFLVWEQDPWAKTLPEMDPHGVVIVDFNPTAENMAQYLVEEIGPMLLELPEVVAKYGTTCIVRCTIEETRKCHATYKLDL